MIPKSCLRAIGWTVGATGVTAAAYGAYAAHAWVRYGKPCAAALGERDALLDEFMPLYDVVERHHIEIEASADIVMAAATEMDIVASPLARAIVRTRELIMRAAPPLRRVPRGVVEETLSMGWGLLAEQPDREIVIGAVTKPWEGDVKFIALTPERFAAFAERGFVKIAWTLRADPISPTRSIFRTETRARATDDLARSRFRRYWALVSPGIRLIRLLSLRSLKNDAESRGRARLPVRATV